MKKLVGAALVAAMLVGAGIGAGGAHAQFGGLGKMAKGLTGGGGAAPADAEAFLTDATRSTKNVMISVALLADAVTKREKLTGDKVYHNAVTKAQNIGELGAHTARLNSDLVTLNGRTNLAGDLQAIYQAGNNDQRRLIGLAVANLAIGVVRNAQLAGKAPAMVSGIRSNPALVTRLGQFRTAAELLGMQAKGLGGIAGSMPKLLAAAKVRGPAAAETSEPKPIAL